MVKIAPFDTARHLDNPQVIAHYLAEALETRDSRLIKLALSNLIRAQRVAAIAREIGMSRTSLYWKKTTSPEFTTVLKVLDKVGVHLEPVAEKPTPGRVPSNELMRRLRQKAQDSRGMKPTVKYRKKRG
jgi:probable addiction module antidote protein